MQEVQCLPTQSLGEKEIGTEEMNFRLTVPTTWPAHPCEMQR